jgi:hypothetical protein
MSTFNAPVATLTWDRDYTAILKITGQYTSSAGASNTKILSANNVKFANSNKPCFLDVVGIQYNMGLANGFVSLEFNNPAGNVTIATFGKRESGDQAVYITNPGTANANASNTNGFGDLNLFTTALDANDSFTITVALRKNDFNGAFANVGLAFDSPWHGP